MSNSIAGAHIFSVGTWNGKTFDVADLDAIVAAFERLAQSGRVPLKFGHNEEQPLTDGQPALGWVSRLWREGGKLLADFADIPSEVYRAIQKGLYKFTSIELLGDVEREGEAFPYVLDAVALLGAEPPAVTGLSDLSKLAAARETPALKFATRTTYACEPDGAPAPRRQVLDETAELAALRAEVAALKAERATFARKEAEKAAIFHRDLLAADLERAVRERRIFPAAREGLAVALHLGDPTEALRFSRAQVATLIKSVDQSRLISHLSSHTARETEGGVRVGFTNRDVGAERLLDAVAAAPAHLKFRAMAETAVLDRDAGESFKRMWNDSPFGARAAIA
ncbi:MAG: hypothetical protein IT530_08775 [Burkholderiales bacterium]|nr:hypothetical protein [Burkholderiales bacterium]